MHPRTLKGRRVNLDLRITLILLYLRDFDGGCEIKVRAQPNAKKSAVAGLFGDALKIAVASPPVDGKANAALTATIAQLAGVSKSRVEVRKGERSKDKIVAIRGIDAAALRRRLSEAGVLEE